MKNAKRKYRFTPAVTLLSYFYFLLISFSHFHSLDINYFSDSTLTTELQSHDYYSSGNFCKLSQSSNLLFLNADGSIVKAAFYGDNVCLKSTSKIPLNNNNPVEKLRAPPSEIS